MRSGVRLALDLGDARIGVAACDGAATLAFPVATVAAGDGELDRLLALIVEYEPVEIVVGLPRSLSGGEGPAAAKVRARASALAARLATHGRQTGPIPQSGPIPQAAQPPPIVRLVDERLTTVSAARQLREAGKSSRQQRSRIDAAAAVAILEHALDSERHRGFPPGELVSAGVSTD
jgi:putative Holliday junction resolvase